MTRLTQQTQKPNRSRLQRLPYGLQVERLEDRVTPSAALVKDINPSPGGEPQELTAIGSTLYFNVLDDTHGRELWKTDGTAGGTSLVKDIDPGVRSSGPQDLIAFQGSLFFTASDQDHG